jgi:hypothetical protein
MKVVSMKAIHIGVSFAFGLVLCLLMIAPSTVVHATNNPALQNYAGKWVLKFQGQNFIVVTLKLEHGKLSGTMARPKHFHIDEDGFNRITPEVEELMISQVSMADGHLKFVAGADNEPDQYSIALADHDHATLAMTGGIPLGRLERASQHEEAAVATHWSEPPPKTFSQEIVALQTEVKKMVDEDQAVRTITPISWPKVEEVDQRNYTEVVRIYEKYGWPTFSLIGKEAANNYWLLVQHQKPEFQEKVLPDLQRAVGAGEASKVNYAYLYDRVMLGQGKPQHWGTQGGCKDGKAILSPVDDSAGLAQRREELRLQPVEEYIKLLDPFCAAEAAPKKSEHW